MNKLVKIILYVFNIIALGIAIYWFNADQSPEPLIVIISQFLVLITLIFESKISNIGISKVAKSKVDVEVKANDDSSIIISDIKDRSNIKVKRK
ncbi:hypothetical protein [Xanthomarina sp. F2636L]|uniref:hypothetical protein n=1 Tax=Xanthomarina sp. F2636L TaxID=2996018 RepID=UPI00225DDFC1|nr:hypothetical protein [Xanthomarina sp. F2636L]MCX7551546.1 hypothetical protein [Xanthomarina sp. F2636L]